MSYSQEIYDAVRSRISNGNVGETIREVARYAFDISHVTERAQEQVYMIADFMTMPSVLYRPKLYPDGNMYCALYGDDLMSGCAGFGKTAHEAMADFDKNWKNQTLQQ